MQPLLASTVRIAATLHSDSVSRVGVITIPGFRLPHRVILGSARRQLGAIARCRRSPRGDRISTIFAESASVRVSRSFLQEAGSEEWAYRA